MRTTFRNAMMTGLLGFSLAVIPMAGRSSAQTAGDTAGGGTGTRSGTSAGTVTTDRHDDGFNMGWLGLIGLAGLAGLLPKKTHTVTTHRTGDTAVR